MPSVIDQLTVVDTAVRKWRKLLFAIADYSAGVIPETLFGEDRTPVALPAGFRAMGYVTTDGATVADSISSEPTNMLQSLQPVRTDITGRDQTLQVAFGEASAWVNALAHLKRVAEFPADPDAAWDFSDGGEITDSPEYAILLYGQDGLGDQAVYRVEAAYRVKISAKPERVLNAAAAETFGFTFSLSMDPASGRVYRRAQDGPGMAGSAFPVIASIEPDGQSVGEMVRIEGSGLARVSAVNFGSVPATDFIVDDASTVYATIPDGASGVQQVTVVAPTGTSAAVEYSVA